MTTMLDRPIQTFDRPPVETVPEAPLRLRPPIRARRERRWPGLLLVGLLAAAVGFGSGFGLGYISRDSEIAQLKSLSQMSTMPSQDVGEGYLSGGSVYDSQVPQAPSVGEGNLPGGSVYGSQVPAEADLLPFPTTVAVPHGVAPVDTPEFPVTVTAQIPHQVAPVDTPAFPEIVIVPIPRGVAPID